MDLKFPRPSAIICLSPKTHPSGSLVVVYTLERERGREKSSETERERGDLMMKRSICPICNLTLPTDELERHANSHFDDDDLERDMELARQLAFAPLSPPSTLKNQLKNDMPFETSTRGRLEYGTEGDKGKRRDGEASDTHEKIICLVDLQIRAPFHKVEASLIVLLKRCLELDSDNMTSMLSGYVDHFQSTVSEDAGWGCGWRNIQMLSSHLLRNRPDAERVLFGGCGYVPDIASLQRWLEIAWERGFDAHGAREFDQKMYGKRVWIGTTECATIFRSFGLRARIVDFDRKNDKASSSIAGSRVSTIKVCGPMDRYLLRGNCELPQAGRTGKEGSSSRGQELLIEWVWNYFSDNRRIELCNNRVIATEKPPLYFQHQGHSRTIVGIQVKRQRKGPQQYNLLVLDPGHNTEALERSLQNNVGWQKLVKRGVHTLRKPQYQLCYIDTGIAHGEEKEQLKTLDSFYMEI